MDANRSDRRRYRRVVALRSGSINEPVTFGASEVLKVGLYVVWHEVSLLCSFAINPLQIYGYLRLISQRFRPIFEVFLSRP